MEVDCNVHGAVAKGTTSSLIDQVDGNKASHSSDFFPEIVGETSGDIPADQSPKVVGSAKTSSASRRETELH